MESSTANYAFRLWIGLPKDQSETLDVLTIMGAVHANYLFAVWNLEMLPSGLGCSTVPLLINNVLAKLIENSKAIDVACWIALIDVDISDATSEV